MRDGSTGRGSLAMLGVSSAGSSMAYSNVRQSEDQGINNAVFITLCKGTYHTKCSC